MSHSIIDTPIVIVYLCKLLVDKDTQCNYYQTKAAPDLTDVTMS